MCGREQALGNGLSPLAMRKSAFHLAEFLFDEDEETGDALDKAAQQYNDEESSNHGNLVKVSSLADSPFPRQVLWQDHQQKPS